MDLTRRVMQSPEVQQRNLSAFLAFSHLPFGGCAQCNDTAKLILLRIALLINLNLRQIAYLTTRQRLMLSLYVSQLRRATDETIYNGRAVLADLQPQVDTTKETVIVMLAVGAEYAPHLVPTLQSLLLHRTCPVDIHFVTDANGFAAALKVVSGLPAPLKVHTAFTHVNLGLDDPQSALNQAINGCQCTPLLHATDTATTTGYHVIMSKLIFWTILPHEVMPASVHRALLFDTGDVLVLGDVYEMWRLFDKFNADQMVGMAQVSVFDMPLLVNSGIALYDLEKMRAGNFTSRFQSVDCGVNKRSLLAAQVAMDQLCRQSPELWFELPSAWHYIPNYDFPLQSRMAFAGLVSPYRIDHPCSSTPELLSYLIQVQVQGEQNTMDAWLSRLSDGILLQQDMDRDHTHNLHCGAKIQVLHCTSTFKTYPWARRLFEFWGMPPPHTYGSAHKGIIFGLRVSEYE